MPVDSFAVLAEPTRRRILDELRAAERSVSELVAALEVSQPAMSKHLKVLRSSGFVSCRTAAQHRIYRIEAGRFEDVDEWLAPYRALWTEDRPVRSSEPQVSVKGSARPWSSFVPR